MDNNTVTCVLAIIAIAIISLVCVESGVDGQLIALSIIAIAGLGGYEVYKRQKNSDPE